MLLEDNIYVGRHFRYASVGGQTDLPSRHMPPCIKRAYSDSAKDPLKRFEYLSNGKATSVMIRATPNAVRWDEINRIQYRFQALNFHSDVLEALIHNSPPLSRREQKAARKTSTDKNVNTLNDDNNNTIKNNNGTSSSKQNNNSVLDHGKNSNRRTNSLKKRTHRSRVTCLQRTNSFDSIKSDYDDSYGKRKGSVVQLTKDDTSDYNSDEDVFPNRSESDSLDSITFNTTICHVNTGHIQDTARIQVTSHNDENDVLDNEISTHTEEKLNRLKDNDNNVSSSRISHTPMKSEHLRDAPVGEDLNSKSKEELVELVRCLQKELETTKQNSLHASTCHQLTPNSSNRSRKANSSFSSKHNLVGKDATSETPLSPKSVHTLIENFERKIEDKIE